MAFQVKFQPPAAVPAASATSSSTPPIGSTDSSNCLPAAPRLSIIA